MTDYPAEPENCPHVDVIRTYNAGMQDDWVCQRCGEWWSANLSRAQVNAKIEQHCASLAQETGFNSDPGTSETVGED